VTEWLRAHVRGANNVTTRERACNERTSERTNERGRSEKAPALRRGGRDVGLPQTINTKTINK
jgi:hypothetical protein